MEGVQIRDLSLLVGMLMLWQLLCVLPVPVFAGDAPEDVADYIRDWAEGSAQSLM